MSDPDSASQIALMAPLSGELIPLENVPDPVFSQKMVGDGIAIDPLSSILYAPCDGEIIYVHAAGHAVTLKTAEDIKILIHVGIDTVKLKGSGFSLRVKKGDHATVGTPLMDLDLDFLAMNAKSLITPVVIANTDRIASFERATGMILAGKDRILSLITKDVSASAPNGALGNGVTGQVIVVPNPLGLHARPAAVMACIAKSFRSDLRLRFGEKDADAKSITCVLGLDVGYQSKVLFSAQGPDAAEAVAKLSEWLEKGLGDEGFRPAPAPASIAIPAAPPRGPKKKSPAVLSGVPCSPGVAAGRVFQVRHRELRIVETADDPDQERELLSRAIERAKAQIADIQARFRRLNDPERAAIFAAHSEMVEDPALHDSASSAIAKGKSAAFAWKNAYEKVAGLLGELLNPVLAQRAVDLRDVGERVLELLAGIEKEKCEYPKNAVLIAEELGPSDLDSSERAPIVGICTTRGGPASHLSVLARALGVPAIAGVDPRALEVPNRALVTLDATCGRIDLNPPLAEVRKILKARRAAEDEYKSHLAHAGEPAKTTDGFRVEVLADIASLEDARQVRGQGGEGVGILRTEFLFVDRESPPTEEEQFEAYKIVVDALGSNQPLCIRCFDVGVEQQLGYLSIRGEETPLLGERGIRVGLDRLDILRTQFRAILRASARGNLSILLPMVSMVRELQEARAILKNEAMSVGVPPVPVGVGVEIPAAAILSAQLARESDFFSINTNNLAQYTLGMDRSHPKLSSRLDALNPGVLRLIARTAAGAHSRGRTVAVCGGIAADAQAVPILVGLAIDQLGVSPPAIPTVKAQIRSLDLSACRQLAQRTLDCDTAAEVRALSSQMA